MELKDIKRTAADKKAEKARWEEPMGGEDYPYGVKLRLDDETIGKIGLGDLNADETVVITAEAFVSEDNVHKRNGKSHRSVELQITKLAVAQKVKADAVDETLYGKD